MRYAKFILIFTVLACILLAFFIYRKENASKANIDNTQEQIQEEIKEEAPAKIDNEYSTYKPASYINSFKVYKTIDTSKDSTEYAKNIMLEYLAGSWDMTVEEYLEKIKEFKPYDHVYGFQFDFNDDETYEIIGFDAFACARITCIGTIIQKQNGKWKDLGYIEFGPSTIIEILQNKTNDYHDIRTLSGRFCGGNFGVPCYPEIKRFKNGGYNYTIYAKEMLDARHKLQ